MKCSRRIGAALIVALALAAPHASAAGDPAAALGDGDRQCLTCHGERGLEKEFA
jgi:mono/diheme cytochrome c family protein